LRSYFFNDGTSLALFLVVLEFLLSAFHGATSVLQGIFIFGGWLGGGIVFGIFMGGIFFKLLEYAKHEYAQMTLTMVVAHLTFIISYLFSDNITLFGMPVYPSSIIATTIALLVVGNYGRYKMSPRIEEYTERFLDYFAFTANSLVFLLLGLLLSAIPIHFGLLVLPMVVAVVCVALARAVSIYPIARLLNMMKREEPIPTSCNICWHGEVCAPHLRLLWYCSYPRILRRKGGTRCSRCANF